MDSIQKINKIRELMKVRDIDAYIIPSGDPHQSEYVAEHWKSRGWVSGFTGSAGTLVITMKYSGLWTDGRYYLQAENQLKGSTIKLFKQGEKNVPTYIEWLEEILDEGETVGFDGKIFPQENVNKINKMLSEKNIIINDNHDLVDMIWKDRPEIIFNKIINHGMEFVDRTVKEKIRLVRDKMKDINVDTYILGSLDDIAWLFNIRGSDIPNNPVTMSYGIITKDKALLFLNTKKLDDLSYENLISNGVHIYEYNDVVDVIKMIDKKDRIYLDANKMNRWIYNAIPKSCKISEGTNITTRLKAIKSPGELENLMNCQVRDGVAMTNFIYWLKNSIGKEEITEISAVNKLKKLRSKQENYIGTSFDTIAGYKEHAAMMHYQPNKESQYTLTNEGMFLVDSGGQYLDGTTDITRTISLGKISKKEKKDFTLVLKGHISLCKMKFLYGATGSNLDVIARYPLWQQGIDYKCGTGHGVGYFLNVHEGPQSFSQIPNKIKLEKNMIITIEPGIYRAGSHGVRIENIVVVMEDRKTEFGQFMKFNTISYCPIDLEAICVDMLSREELEWLNEYHQKVYDKISPYLEDNIKKWLKLNTQPIRFRDRV